MSAPDVDISYAVAMVELVLEFGATADREPGEWKLRSDTEDLAAAIGHIVTHMRGRPVDDDSGLPHLAHAAARLALVLERRKADPGLVLLK